MVLSKLSPKITQLETPPASPFAPLTATPREPRAVSRLVRSASHLVASQTPRSLKLKALIGQLRRTAQGALADKGLGDEMDRMLPSGAKDTFAAAAMDRRHLTKAWVIDNEDSWRLREERIQNDAVKAQRAKNREIRQQATAAAAKPVAGSEKCAQKKANGSKEAPLSLLNDGEETEGEVLGNESDSGAEIWEEEDSFVDIDDLLDHEGAAGCGVARLGVLERPPVITKSGRAVKAVT